MPANSTIGGLQQEHGLARFLGHGHQGPVVFQLGEASVIIVNANRKSSGRDSFNLFPVDGRKAVQPVPERLDLASLADGVAGRHSQSDACHLEA